MIIFSVILDKPEGNDPTAIIATGFAGSTEEDTIIRYFSDPGESGGGPLESIEYNEDEDSFTIVFSSSEGKFNITCASQFHIRAFSE